MPVAASAGAAQTPRDARSARVRSLFGTESEYAVSAERAGLALPPADVARLLLAHAERHPHLPGVEAGIFLPSGGRFYIDQSHPEWASPECTNPWDAARHSLAGDLLLSRLVGDAARADPSMANLAVRKGNADYESRVTWGNHENYLLHSDPHDVRPGLVSHLVTRIVFAGAGGFDPFETRHPLFVLSPRALFMRAAVGSSRAGALALVDVRSQHHCAGFYRQHLMCGEGLQSHRATLLRLGTTALVLALLDGRLADLAEVALADPLGALSIVARDQTLQRRLVLRAGGEATGLDIQRHLLRQARAHLARLPEWGEELCDEWEDVLNRLAQGPDAVADRLDWAIKLAMYRDHARRRAVPWWPTGDNAVSDEAAPPTREAEQWRAELCELDVRFGQVYPPSVFDSLDRAGVLAHRVARIDKVDDALATPPAEGRASLRGAAVRRLAGRAGVRCAWDGVYDVPSHTFLGLADPFAATAAWTRLPPNTTYRAGSSVPGSGIAGLPADADALRALAERLCAPDAADARRAHGAYAIDFNNRGIELRGMGRLEHAEVVLRAALAIDLQVRPAGHPKLPHRRNNLAGALLMLGRLEEALRLVSTAWAEKAGLYDLTSARILTTRLVLAMRRGEPTALFVGQLKTHLAIRPLPDYADVDPRWIVAPALAALERHLAKADLRILKGITDVLNGDGSIDSLRALPAWKNTLPRPLDAPWPFPPLAAEPGP